MALAPNLTPYPPVLAGEGEPEHSLLSGVPASFYCPSDERGIHDHLLPARVYVRIWCGVMWKLAHNSQQLSPDEAWRLTPPPAPPRRGEGSQNRSGSIA